MDVVGLFIFVGCVNVIFVQVESSGLEYLTLSRVIPIFGYGNVLRDIFFRFSGKTIVWAYIFCPATLGLHEYII